MWMVWLWDYLGKSCLCLWLRVNPNYYFFNLKQCNDLGSCLFVRERNASLHHVTVLTDLCLDNMSKPALPSLTKGVFSLDCHYSFYTSLFVLQTSTPSTAQNVMQIWYSIFHTACTVHDIGWKCDSVVGLWMKEPKTFSKEEPCLW